MQNFEVIARAVIAQDNKLLLCKQKDRDYWFLPGGHVEFGESAETALEREIQEELGVAVSDIRFIGAGENIFTQNGERHHEFNLIFSAEILGTADTPIASLEDHLEFVFMELANFGSANFLPKSLHRAIRLWVKTKQVFWLGES